MNGVDAFCIFVIVLGVGSIVFGAWSAWHGAYSFAPKHPDEPSIAAKVAAADEGTYTTLGGAVLSEPPVKRPHDQEAVKTEES